MASGSERLAQISRDRAASRARSRAIARQPTAATPF